MNMNKYHTTNTHIIELFLDDLSIHDIYTIKLAVILKVISLVSDF